MPQLDPKVRALLQEEAAKRGIVVKPPTRLQPQCPEWAHLGQKGWYESLSRINIGLAGTQGGKTAMLPHILIQRASQASEVAQKVGKGDLLYVGATLELLKKQALPDLERVWCQEEGLGQRVTYAGTPKLHLTKLGAKRLYGFECPATIHIAYANDSSNLESLTALAAAWDEAGQKENKEESYFALERRLTVAKSMGLGRIDIGTTPYEWGWLKTILIDSPDEDVSVHNWPSWWNPVTTEESCREMLGRMPLWKWEMMYLGKYTKPAGVVYDCFDEGNIVEPFKVPKAWPLYIGVDFGLINTAAVIIAEELKKDWAGRWTDEPTGEYFVVGTYHAGEARTAKEHLRAIREVCDGVVEGGESQRPTAVGGSHQESGWREAYALSGLGISEPSINKVESQIACLYAAFKTKKLRVFRTCTKFVGECESFSYELDEHGDPTEKLAEEAKYHRLAGARYIATRLFKTVERKSAPKLMHGYA